jgi:hypothetical protein
MFDSNDSLLFKWLNKTEMIPGFVFVCVCLLFVEPFCREGNPGRASKWQNYDNGRICAVQFNYFWSGFFLPTPFFSVWPVYKLILDKTLLLTHYATLFSNLLSRPWFSLFGEECAANRGFVDYFYKFFMDPPLHDLIFM